MSINITQQPKTQGYLECWKPRPGFRLINSDLSSIEPVVLTAASGDESLYKIYGPGQPPNDIYLFVAAHITGLDKVREYYDPDNPTKESIKLAKQHCNHERQISKKVTLAANYLAGPNKIHQELTLAGIKITLEEVRKIHRDYWQLFEGVAEFREYLEEVWEDNGGWILDCLGCPITVAPHLKKDLVNRFCLDESTLVRVRGKGFLKITDVAVNDEVWDGSKWVHTGGCIYRGYKKIINIDNVYMTEDHKILTKYGGFSSASDIKRAGTKIVKREARPDATWTEIWRLGNYIIRQIFSKWTDFCKGKMST